MTKRYQHAAEIRAYIKAQLGGVCAVCGVKDGLQFHLVVGAGREHHLMSGKDRAHFYLHELNRKNLRLLCARCHSANTVGANRARYLRESAYRRPGRPSAATGGFCLRG